ncbi:hypothetical protein AGMMS50256_06050 [Betaproteobacteria bacterium]|nr:hypothetical protein AGMMS50256_06050 [Betaproteobacteria bacterium]
MTDTAAQNRPLPRSYMPEEEKEGLSQNLIYICEAREAIKAGDEEAGWAWMTITKLPECAIYAMKNSLGEEFLKSKGFDI